MYVHTGGLFINVPVYDTLTWNRVVPGSTFASVYVMLFVTVMEFGGAIWEYAVVQNV
jgi:hypothetical protein